MIEQRAIVQSEMSGEDGAEMFYADLLNPLPVGTKLTTVADVLAALREVTPEMFDVGATEIYGATREQAKEYAKTEKFESAGREAIRTFIAMLDAFERDQGSAT